MKNSIKTLFFAAAIVAAVSCEDKPSTLSYTLTGNFNYVAENPSTFPVNDSLYFSKYIMMDDYSVLCTDCTDVNTDFNGGWKVSLKKGSMNDTDNLLLYSSAGNSAGYSDQKTGFASKAYAVYTPCPSSDYDIVFKYADNFTKSNCNVIGFYINNTKYIEKLAEEGQINEGEFLAVTATFFKNGIPVCEEEFVLVDYTGSERKVVKDWTAWDMQRAKTKDVDAVKFSISTTSLPPYFCLDFLLASVSVEY